MTLNDNPVKHLAVGPKDNGKYVARIITENGARFETRFERKKFIEAWEDLLELFGLSVEANTTE